jgi:U1 small nuclear ribonucleoprotein
LVTRSAQLGNFHLPSSTKMPGTHLLPPNLLKLFAPRPPLPYSRPVDRDIDRIFNKNVVGVAHILVQLKEANTDSLITAGTSDAMEEGEEPVFTHAEETKRQIRREERKAKKTEEFKIAKETCQLIYISLLLLWNCNCIPIDKPADDPEAVGDPYKTLFISRLVLVLILTLHSSY